MSEYTWLKQTTSDMTAGAVASLVSQTIVVPTDVAINNVCDTIK